MNKTIYKGIILGIITTSCICTAKSQTAAKDTLLNRQVLLEREYTPKIQDASKINKTPAIYTPQQKATDIKFERTIPYVEIINFEVKEIGTGNIRADIQKSKQKGYLSFDAGMYSNLNANAGYRILENSNNQLDLFGIHNSTNGTVDYIDKLNDLKDVKAKNMLNFIKAKFNHKFESAKWYIDASYLNNSFNYYGNPYLINGAENVDEKILNLEKKQAVNIFEIETGLSSLKANDNGINYSGAVKFNHFSSKYSPYIYDDGLSGNIFDAKIDINQNFSSDKYWGVRGNLFFQKFGNHKNSWEITENEKTIHNLTIVKANPYFKLENNDITLLVGANINWGIDESNSFAVTPTIDASWVINDNNKLYLTVDGGINDNSFISIYKQNKYYNSLNRVKISKTLYDALFGFRSGAIAGFEFDIFGGYKYTKDEHLFVPSTSPSWGLISDVAYTNLGTGTIGGTVKTKLIPYTDLSAHVNTYFYSLKKISNLPYEQKAWGLPSFNLGLNADFSFINNLLISANYEFSGGRKALLNSTSVNLKNINELNLKASYQILDWLALYVKANNVLNQKYENFYGYPLQGIAASGGFSVLF